MLDLTYTYKILYIVIVQNLNRYIPVEHQIFTCFSTRKTGLLIITTQKNMMHTGLIVYRKKYISFHVWLKNSDTDVRTNRLLKAAFKLLASFKVSKAMNASTRSLYWFVLNIPLKSCWIVLQRLRKNIYEWSLLHIVRNVNNVNPLPRFVSFFVVILFFFYLGTGE